MIENKLNLEWHKEWRRCVVEAFVNCRDLDVGDHIEIPLSDWERLQASIMKAPSRTLPFVETVNKIIRSNI